MEKSQPKIKTCPECGQTFECLHSLECWCLQVKLSKQTLQALSEKYGDCLCPSCLSKYAEKVKEI